MYTVYAYKYDLCRVNDRQCYLYAQIILIIRIPITYEMYLPAATILLQYWKKSIKEKLSVRDCWLGTNPETHCRMSNAPIVYSPLRISFVSKAFIARVTACQLFSIYEISEVETWTYVYWFRSMCVYMHAFMSAILMVDNLRPVSFKRFYSRCNVLSYSYSINVKPERCRNVYICLGCEIEIGNSWYTAAADVCMSTYMCTYITDWTIMWCYFSHLIFSNTNYGTILMMTRQIYIAILLFLPYGPLHIVCGFHWTLRT